MTGACRRGYVQHAVHSQLEPIVEVAWHVGINFIDVAEHYANRGRHQPKLRKPGMGQELATRAGRLHAGSGGDSSESDLASAGASAPEAALGAGRGAQGLRAELYSLVEAVL